MVGILESILGVGVAAFGPEEGLLLDIVCCEFSVDCAGFGTSISECEGSFLLGTLDDVPDWLLSTC
jgi:hypothetical protein